MGVDKISGETRNITAKISAHYVDNARELPWRIMPHQSADGILPDPYYVWLSEVMLQQTTVAAVVAYFVKFIRHWPTIADLAAADEADVLAAWAGLGYYARARNLHKCARYIVSELDGAFPATEADLLKLPGVGAYTAAAIAAIAFGARAIVVDANIERLVARLFAIDTPLPGGKKDIRIAMDALTPDAEGKANKVGDFAQACMDIGAGICTAKSPKCSLCPVQIHCVAHARGNPELHPVKPPKKAKPIRKGRFFWIEQDGKLLLVTRPPTGMLGSMRALPDDDWAAGKDGHGQPPLTGGWQLRENLVQHSFTHFSLEVDVAVYHSDKNINKTWDNHGAGLGSRKPIWWPIDTIEDAGLPTLYLKAVNRILGQGKRKD
ncbi:NUDIX domain-containing protein [Parasphingorhabdus sp. JC815]|uniref:A/G-specific adenine glycosylase n=1 Tax=Parasphingorhabdus sp. JC815 TaxID=3232140 RepID=UPI00345AD08C